MSEELAVTSVTSEVLHTRQLTKPIFQFGQEGRLQQGRTFNETDVADHPQVVIINETAAHNFWPNESPIGKRISNTAPKKDFYEIIGVVNDVAFPGSLGEPYTRYEAFIPVAQAAPGYLMILLRTSANPETVGNSLRNSIAGLDPNLPVYRIRTARAAVDQGLGSISLLGSLPPSLIIDGYMIVVRQRRAGVANT